MDLGLKDKVIMIAGSSKGLGYGIAEACAREGAKLSIASRDADGIESAAQALRTKHSSEVFATTFDASQPASIEKWASGTLAEFNRIDCLVVNAGGPPSGKFDELDDELWKKAFELTLLSAVRMIRSVLPAMKKQQSGSIVTITSTSIKEPIELLLLSNVLRSGVASLVKSLASDLGPQGIRINNLVPGRFDTDRMRELDLKISKSRDIDVEEHRKAEHSGIPLRRYGSPEELGAAGAFLLSDAASYINGATLVVDGGKTRAVW